MQNDAKYPLISRAIHKPAVGVQPLPHTLFSPKTDKTNNGTPVLTHRDCNCFINVPSDCKQHAIKRQDFKSKSFRPAGGQRSVMLLPAGPSEAESTSRGQFESRNIAVDLDSCDVGKKREKSREKLVFIPAVITSSRQSVKYRTAKLLSVDNLSEAPVDRGSGKAATAGDFFQRGRYLRSSYDKSLLMYSHRSGIYDITNSIGIEKLLQKFRTKLHGSKTAVEPKEFSSMENQVQQDHLNSEDNTLL